MLPLSKACAVPYRRSERGLEVLAFRHPLAGKQFVKGTLEDNEEPEVGACRELHEESGLSLELRPVLLGVQTVGNPPLPWCFFAFETDSLPDRWDHRTEDGGGQTFSFFWHFLDQDLDDGWHPIFHEAFRTIRSTLPQMVRTKE